MTQTLSTQAVKFLEALVLSPITRDFFGPGDEVRDALRELEQGGYVWNNISPEGQVSYLTITPQGVVALLREAKREGFEQAMKQAEAMTRSEGAYWNNIEQGDMPGFASGKFRKLADKFAAIDPTKEV